MTLRERQNTSQWVCRYVLPHCSGWDGYHPGTEPYSISIPYSVTFSCAAALSHWSRPPGCTPGLNSASSDLENILNSNVTGLASTEAKAAKLWHLKLALTVFLLELVLVKVNFYFFFFFFSTLYGKFPRQMYFLFTIWLYSFFHVAWFNLRQPVSPTQLLAHSPHGEIGERIRGVKARKLIGWDKDSLLGQTREEIIIVAVIIKIIRIHKISDAQCNWLTFANQCPASFWAEAPGQLSSQFMHWRWCHMV